MTTREGRLPSLAAIAAAVHRVGDPFSVRGIEAVVEGSVESTPEGPILRASGTGQAFALAPATRKVQWDSRTKQDQPISERERAAYARLAREVSAGLASVRAVGRVVSAEPGLPILEVRTFHAIPDGKRR